MSKGAATFRKADIKRGVEALKSAGMKVDRVQVDKSGKLEFVLSDGGDTGAENVEEIKL
jgi:hypothetical protein